MIIPCDGEGGVKELEGQEEKELEMKNCYKNLVCCLDLGDGWNNKNYFFQCFIHKQ